MAVSARFGLRKLRPQLRVPRRAPERDIGCPIVDRWPEITRRAHTWLSGAATRLDGQINASMWMSICRRLTGCPRVAHRGMSTGNCWPDDHDRVRLDVGLQTTGLGSRRAHTGQPRATTGGGGGKSQLSWWGSGLVVTTEPWRGGCRWGHALVWRDGGNVAKKRAVDARNEHADTQTTGTVVIGRMSAKQTTTNARWKRTPS
jgi:hypothetical protein